MMRIRRQQILFLVLAVITLLVVTDVAGACPTCKDSLAQGPNAVGLVRGYFWSIVFMMSMPFVILLGLGTYFYWEVRKARTAIAAGPYQPQAAVAGGDGNTSAVR
jgi:heme/copper-type cytochrome/quinol oxidase subunit 2